jgi:glycosyltransferase involved in cell wall biosynthesis
MHKEGPLISVVLPTYNRSKLLTRAIDSALAQTYQNYELIIIDDGSTDDTESVVNQYSDTRIVYLKQNVNRGGAEARNIGIKEAKGEYIALLDSDDEWLPEKLDLQVGVIATGPKNLGVIYTGCYRVDGDQKSYSPDENVKVKSGNVFGQILEYNFIAATTLLIKKEALDSVGGFYKDLPRAQDWELLIRLSKDWQFDYVKEVMAYSYIQDDSISVNRLSLREGYKMVLNRHRSDFVKNKTAFARINFHIGNACLLTSETHVGRKFLLQAFYTQSTSLRYVLALVLSIFGSQFYKRAFNIRKSL